MKKRSYYDINEVIKRYEEETKKKIPTPPKLKSEGAKKRQDKKLFIIPVVLIIVFVVFFAFLKKKGVRARVKRVEREKREIKIMEVDGVPVFGEPQKIEKVEADGVITKIYKVGKKLDDVQIFYQKRMSEKGYLIEKALKTNGKIFRFVKGGKEVVINLIPLKENETCVLISHK